MMAETSNSCTCGRGWGGTRERSHAARPGSGPDGSTCGACAWSVEHDDRYRARMLKCNLTDWDATAATDISGGDRACIHFDARE